MRANQPVTAGIRGDRGGQHAGDRGDRSVKREFAENRVICQSIRRNGADGGHDAERDRQIVAAFLWKIGGREIDGDALGGHGEARGIERGAHSFARFSDRLVAEADNREDHIAIGDLYLHIQGRASMPSNATVATLTTMATPRLPISGKLNLSGRPNQEQ